MEASIYVDLIERVTSTHYWCALIRSWHAWFLEVTWLLIECYIATILCTLSDNYSCLHIVNIKTHESGLQVKLGSIPVFV